MTRGGPEETAVHSVHEETEAVGATCRSDGGFALSCETDDFLFLTVPEITGPFRASIKSILLSKGAASWSAGAPCFDLGNLVW
jgi:hypothetical protein